MFLLCLLHCGPPRGSRIASPLMQIWIKNKNSKWPYKWKLVQETFETCRVSPILLRSALNFEYLCWGSYLNGNHWLFSLHFTGMVDWSLPESELYRGRWRKVVHTCISKCLSTFFWYLKSLSSSLALLRLFNLVRRQKGFASRLKRTTKIVIFSIILATYQQCFFCGFTASNVLGCITKKKSLTQ